MKPDVQTEQPLRDHLQEFRKRLIICLVVVAIAALACYNYVLYESVGGFLYLYGNSPICGDLIHLARPFV